MWLLILTWWDESLSSSPPLRSLWPHAVQVEEQEHYWLVLNINHQVIVPFSMLPEPPTQWSPPCCHTVYLPKALILTRLHLENWSTHHSPIVNHYEVNNKSDSRPVKGIRYYNASPRYGKAEPTDRANWVMGVMKTQKSTVPQWTQTVLIIK